MMEPKDAKWLEDRGWSKWYNENYWVHPDSVQDPTRQNYTDYGFSLEEAVKYESIGKPKHKYLGLPQLSKIDMAVSTKGLTTPYIEE